VIRDYVPDDEDAVVEVWRAASAVGHPFMDPAMMDPAATELRSVWLPKANSRVVEVDGRVVGFISMLDHEIGGLFVDPEFHRRGLGRSLVDDVRHLGALEVEVFVRNEVGRRFYERYGFVEIGNSFHEATGEPVLRLRIE
jgi:putative acetyltransferase